jgi:hypothetical protein
MHKHVGGQQELLEVDGLERNMPFLLRIRFLEAANLRKKRTLLTAVAELVGTQHRDYNVLKIGFISNGNRVCVWTLDRY